MTMPGDQGPELADGGRGAVPETMVAVVARRYGGPEVVAVETVPTPKPARGELLVRVAASSANALDWHFLTGTPYFLRLIAGLRRPRRLIPGSDVAGTVVAVGTGVSGVHVGDTVFGECAGGGFASFVTVDANHVVGLPPGVELAAAAATPVAGLTALQGLRTHAAVRAGDRVLINGAAGGVGTFALQVARALGAGGITAVCSTGNVEQARTLGATRVIDYLRDDFVEAGAEYDVVLDMVGNRTTAQILSILAPDGRYVAVSGPKANRWLGPVPHLARTRLRFSRASQTFHQFTAAPDVGDLRFLAQLLASGELTPAIDRVVGFDGVAAALDEIGAGHLRAKIVVVPSDGPQTTGHHAQEGLTTS